MMNYMRAALRLGMKSPLAGKAMTAGNNWARVGWERRGYKVTVVGAAGGIGQPLSLLLKRNPLIDELTLHDLACPKGVAIELSHICTSAQVDFFGGEKEQDLIDAMHDSHVIVVPAGLPRKIDMTREQLLGANANVARSVACAAAVACPEALLAFITNPVNTLVPIAAEFLRSMGVYNPKRLFGVTTLDVIRAKTFIGDFMNMDPGKVNIPVIGGHSGDTILPIFSQCSPPFKGDEDEIRCLTTRIQQAGAEVIKAKGGTGSATLSMAYAGAHFVDALLRGLNNEPDVIECAYVESSVTELQFFATPLLLGPRGIQSNLGLPDMDDRELAAMRKMMPELKRAIDLGIRYAQDIIKKSEKKKKTAGDELKPDEAQESAQLKN